MKYAAALFVVLLAVWLLLSGHFTVQMISFGVASCLFAVFASRRMGLLDAEGVPVAQAARALAYGPWLLWEIVKSNVDVARRIIDPRLPIAPRLIRVRPGQSSDLGRVVYANSITLTPGTVSLRVLDDEILVHALTREAAEGLATGEMDRRATWLEGGG